MSDENFNLAGLYRILISENVPLVQNGLSLVVNKESDMAVCGHSASVLETLAAIERQMPDVLIMGMDVAGEESFETISQIAASYPETRIIALSLSDNGQDQIISIRAGAKGFMDRTSSAETVVDAIREVLAGGTWFPESDIEQDREIAEVAESERVDIRNSLTKREIQIFEMIGSGISAKEISNKLFISQRTVESHRDHIKNKLDFKDAFHLHQFAFEWVNDHKKVQV